MNNRSIFYYSPYDFDVFTKLTIVVEGIDTGKYQSCTEDETDEVTENEEETQNHVFLVYELRKLYGKFIAVQDISFGVKESECFGLLGVNGAGKSTTFKMMTAEIIPNHGVLHLRDKNSRDQQNVSKKKNIELIISLVV